MFMGVYLHLLYEANPGRQYLSSTLLELERRLFLCFHLLWWLVSRFSGEEAHHAQCSRRCGFITLSTGSDFMLFFIGMLDVSVISIQGQLLCMLAEKQS